MIVGVGVDLVELERIRGVLERHGERFLTRILTADERAYCESRKDSVPHVAARFAAKEATLKALGTGWSRGIQWTDVETIRDASGAPRLQLRGTALAIATELAGDGARWHLSLTHDRHAAVAVVVLER